jgi:hypothetical protein
MGETLNFYGSILALIGCVSFIGLYSGMAPWWKGHVGRMLVTKAAAIGGLMAITVAFYAFDLDQEWIRVARGCLSFVIAAMMFYQTYLVYALQKEREDA